MEPLIVGLSGLVMVGLGVIGLALAVVMFLRTARDLASGRIRSASIINHAQSVRQIEAMRGPGQVRSGMWDGIDRLGSAGMDRGGGTL